MNDYENKSLKIALKKIEEEVEDRTLHKLAEKLANNGWTIFHDQLMTADTAGNLNVDVALSALRALLSSI